MFCRCSYDRYDRYGRYTAHFGPGPRPKNMPMGRSGGLRMWAEAKFPVFLMVSLKCSSTRAHGIGLNADGQ